MFNIKLTYRNSSCHLGFCHRFTSCASGHTIWKDKQETPGGMGNGAGLCSSESWDLEKLSASPVDPGDPELTLLSACK